MNTPINSQTFSTYNTSNSCYAVDCGMRENCSSNVYNCTNFFCQRRCTIRYPYNINTDHRNVTIFNYNIYEKTN